MICLLLIMTIVFINNIESAEQKIKHPDTLLKEEDMTAKTKIWLLMVESGKVDQEELRRITPKSIFIAPLLTSRSGKCKEGYRHDHLGQCVKVIKIDPKVQLELLLQRLNQLYGEKKETKEEQKEEEEKTEEPEVSNGPLHFSFPISNVNDRTEKENNETNTESPQEGFKPTENYKVYKTETTPELIPIPLPMKYKNHNDQMKDFESSGAEPLNVTEPIELSNFEGSGDIQVSSGDDFPEEKTTTALPVSLIPEETDYFDITETESTTVAENQFSVTLPTDMIPTVKPETPEEVSLLESYRNTTDTPSVYNKSEVLPKEKTQVPNDVVRNNSNSDKIIFPSDDDDRNESLRTSAQSSFESSRIRFPDEISEPPTPSYHSLPGLNSKSGKHHTQSSAMPWEQFWWLPKNWQIDENQQRSHLVKVWSRLPLIHDISYAHENSDDFIKSDYVEQPHSQMFNLQHQDKKLSVSSNRQESPTRILKPFRNNRFQDIILTQRPHFRLH